jgi:hypothetical protein
MSSSLIEITVSALPEMDATNSKLLKTVYSTPITVGRRSRASWPIKAKRVLFGIESGKVVVLVMS